MMGIAGSFKVVFSKYQKQAFINQPRNREWASLIEAIGTTGERLPLFVILKLPDHVASWKAGKL